MSKTVKEITFDYKELKKFIEEINTKLQDRFSFYLVNNQLSLYDTVYSSVKGIKGKISKTEKKDKEINDKELIKPLEDNYLFINLIRIKSKMSITELKRVVQINTKLDNFYPNLSFFREYNLKNKLYHLKYAFTNKLETETNTKRIKELFNQINDLSNELYNKIF